jgi:two-component system chemotaxis response regulator CheB
VPRVKRIRVLVVDDSPLARRLLTRALGAHPEMEVVGTAANAAHVLAKLPALDPDAVVLDVDLPELDGVSTLRRIRAADPQLPVVLLVPEGERTAHARFDALSEEDALAAVIEGVLGERLVLEVLAPKIVELVRSVRHIEERSIGDLVPEHHPRPLVFPGPVPSPARGRGTTPEMLSRVTRLRARGLGSFDVVALAASTGGPEALARIIPSLAADFPVPILIVQHMPPSFTHSLAERLDVRSALAVREASGGELVEPGTVWIARGGRHLEVAREGFFVRTHASDGPPENSCRPAADVLFRSVARAYGSRVLAVVLTGMGEDGLRGATEIVRAGGHVIAQSGRSCVVWGMPKAIEDAGIADAVVPLDAIASSIEERVRGPLRPRASYGR